MIAYNPAARQPITADHSQHFQNMSDFVWCISGLYQNWKIPEIETAKAGLDEIVLEHGIDCSCKLQLAPFGIVAERVIIVKEYGGDLVAEYTSVT